MQVIPSPTDRVRQIVATIAEVEPDQIESDTHFYDDLLCDSLQQLEIVVQVERTFAVKLSDVEAASLHRVRDAIVLLRGKGAIPTRDTADA
jgi:acyl carrier protein